jgi:hypothetical protein
MGRTGNLALTSARALPDTPPETLNSSYVCTFSTGADVPVAAFLLSLIGAAKAPVRERKIVSGVEKCMMINACVVSCRNEWSGIKMNVFASLSLKESLNIGKQPSCE